MNHLVENRSLFKIASLNHCINYVMKPLTKYAKERELCTGNDKRLRLLHLLTAFSIVLTPEAENILIVKEENPTAMCSLSCEINQKNLPRFSTEP